MNLQSILLLTLIVIAALFAIRFYLRKDCRSCHSSLTFGSSKNCGSCQGCTFAKDCKSCIP